AVGPRDSLRFARKVRNHHEVAAGIVAEEIWLFANQRRFVDHRVGWGGPVSGGRVGRADEDHVPHAAVPTPPLAVAREPLLLRSRYYPPINSAVRHEPAAGPSAIPEVQIAFQVSSAQGPAL